MLFRFLSRTNFYPHEVNPEVLHWRSGDRVICGGWFNSLWQDFVTYKGISDNGELITDSTTIKLSSRHWKRMYNRTLRERNHQRKLESISNGDYMRLIAEFQKSVNELEFR